jgi:hypothetical protein
MRPTSMMDDLKRNASALGVYGIGHIAPARYLCGTIDARHLRITVALADDGRRFSDDQAGCRALSVILRADELGCAVRIGPHARQRRHDDSIRKLECS